MEERVEATLDLTDCKYLGELHQRIKVALDFPEHYGENWSAFWDSLRFDSPVEYVRIVGECTCLLYTSPSPRDRTRSRMPSSA